jgi:DNA mismatch repair protein MutS
MSRAPKPDTVEQRPPPQAANGRAVAAAAHDGQGSSVLQDGSRSRTVSVLFADAQAAADAERAEQPAFFGDLNLDQVVGTVLARNDPYGLAPFFYAPLGDPDAIRFRQEVFAELERAEVWALMTAFATEELVTRFTRQRRAMREDDMGFSHYHRACAFLNTVLGYCAAVERLTDGLTTLGVRARGLLGLRDYLVGYRDGQAFGDLRTEARALDEELGRIRYTFLLKGSRITVGPYDEQSDYSVEVSATFERFRQGSTTNYLPEFHDWETYASIGVLHLVAQVYPDPFGRLDAFCAQYADYLDDTVRLFDRELQFYLSYLNGIRPLRDRGLCFSRPAVSCDDKAERALDTFDLALAMQRAKDGEDVVCNDVQLDAGERILVITGPNNGGKTTLARAIGQLHHLARLGCPVPGRDTRLFVCDEIFTRFERQEDIETLTGKLQGELNRLRDALAEATGDSLFVLNEMFNSTTAQDALLLSRGILDQVGGLDALCVCVTFLDELATHNDSTVSMVGTVDPADPAIRTYRLVRRRADGRAYARAIAEKYGLTYEHLTARSRA